MALGDDTQNILQGFNQLGSGIGRQVAYDREKSDRADEIKRQEAAANRTLSDNEMQIADMMIQKLDPKTRLQLAGNPQMLQKLIDSISNGGAVPGAPGAPMAQGPSPSQAAPLGMPQAPNVNGGLGAGPQQAAAVGSAPGSGGGMPSMPSGGLGVEAPKQAPAIAQAAAPGLGAPQSAAPTSEGSLPKVRTAREFGTLLQAAPYLENKGAARSTPEERMMEHLLPYLLEKKGAEADRKTKVEENQKDRNLKSELAGKKWGNDLIKLGKVLDAGKEARAEKYDYDSLKKGDGSALKLLEQDERRLRGLESDRTKIGNTIRMTGEDPTDYPEYKAIESAIFELQRKTQEGRKALPKSGAGSTELIHIRHKKSGTVQALPAAKANMMLKAEPQNFETAQ